MSYFSRWLALARRGVFPVKREPLAIFDHIREVEKMVAGYATSRPPLRPQSTHQLSLTHPPVPHFSPSFEEGKQEVLTVDQAIDELNFFRCLRPLSRQMVLTRIITDAAAHGDEHAHHFISLLQWNSATALH